MDLLIQDSKRFIDNLFWIVWAGLFWVKSVGKKCNISILALFHYWDNCDDPAGKRERISLINPLLKWPI
ncbi:hypothetical protein FE394_12040 [Xenorhabdus sp. Reich]|uniref:Uncharacterized protein n=1 Tax=Xenorhabdus littoralis TaxID=2582835 RepID=A0ABU4SMN7_9GAMM|nr:hypothetical protein [Xenorhabdus sp. Reich]MDX7999918.1 hypothetical protein [Xenorhabdus sp. Reich]